MSLGLSTRTRSITWPDTECLERRRHSLQIAVQAGDEQVEVLRRAWLAVVADRVASEQRKFNPVTANSANKSLKSG